MGLIQRYLGRAISGQFRRPSGPLGLFFGNGMARQNAFEAEWTVSLLQIQPSERVLEVGFGPGVGIEQAVAACGGMRAGRGWVAGVDASPTMVQAARRRNAAAITAGRVALREGDVAALPYPADSFDAAFSIHCIYFWPDPAQGLRELARVLRPGGRLAVTLMPREVWLRERPGVPADIFRLYSGPELQQLLSAAGFQSVTIQASPQLEKFPGLSVLGVAP